MKYLISNATLLTFNVPGLEGPRAGKFMERIGLVRDGALLMDQGKIVSVGRSDLVLKHPDAKKARMFDAEERVVMPGFVDSHTHPAFGEARLTDFDLRVRGKSYQEIARQGGGIASSIHALRGTTEAALTKRVFNQARRFLECGTTTIEAKTGYGLDKDSELKALRAFAHVGAGSPLEILPTFLGAHAIPPEFGRRSKDFIEMLCSEILPAVTKERLARFVDAFVEQGYFTAGESEIFLRAGMAAGLRVKIHAEQLSHSGGAALAARLKAVSADHLDHATDADLKALKESGTVASLVPGSNHYLGMDRYPPARRILNSGVAVALATDFNPGSCPCWNMQEILSIAVTRMKMTPDEALVASTINGAYALDLGETHGSLEIEKQADVVIYDCRDYRELPYWFGANLAAVVFKKGKIVHQTLDLPA